MKDLDKRYIPKKRPEPVILIAMSIDGYGYDPDLTERPPFKVEVVDRSEHSIRVESCVTGYEYTLNVNEFLEHMDNEQIVKILT